MSNPRNNTWKFRCLNLATLLTAALLTIACLETNAKATPISEPVGYKISICESYDVLKNPNDAKAAMMAAWTTPGELAQQRSKPFMVLENTKVGGTGNAELKDFYMTIGDSANHFDWAKIIKTPAGVTAKVVNLDSKEGGAKNDLLQLKFSGFKPGMKVYFQIDIDPDVMNYLQFGDYRTVLFTMNGGPNTAGNSLHRARFVDDSMPTDFDRFLTPYAAWSNPIITYPTSVGLQPRSSYQMDHVEPFNTSNVGLMPVPEPSTYVLASFGVVALGLAYRRRTRK